MEGLEFRGWGLGFEVEGLRFEVSGFWFLVLGFRFLVWILVLGKINCSRMNLGEEIGRVSGDTTPCRTRAGLYLLTADVTV